MPAVVGLNFYGRDPFPQEGLPILTARKSASLSISSMGFLDSVGFGNSTLDMTISTGRNNLMRVSSVELKTRLGHYLRTVEQTGEPIEICVRGRLVAALMPHQSAPTVQGAKGRDALTMNRALERSGLRVEPARRSADDADIRPLPAGDGRTDINTVEAMRQTRDW